MNKNIKKMSFEEAVNQLKDTIVKMQEPNISLDNLVEYYESGLLLKKHAQSLLSQAKLRIEKINQTNDTELSNELQSQLIYICTEFINHALEDYTENKQNPDWEILVNKLESNFKKLTC